jgi:hypothetical protein
VEWIRAESEAGFARMGTGLPISHFTWMIGKRDQAPLPMMNASTP